MKKMYQVTDILAVSKLAHVYKRGREGEREGEREGGREREEVVDNCLIFVLFSSNDSSS